MTSTHLVGSTHVPVHSLQVLHCDGFVELQTGHVEVLAVLVREHEGEEQRQRELSGVGQREVHAMGEGEQRQPGHRQLQLVVVLQVVVVVVVVVVVEQCGSSGSRAVRNRQVI